MRNIVLRYQTTFRCALFAFAMGMLGGFNAANADSALGYYEAGAVYKDTIKLPHYSIPLPPGEWHVSSVNEARNDANNVNLNLGLVKIEKGVFAAGIEISTNVDLGRHGWQTHPMCTRTNVYYRVTDADYPKEQACRWVTHYTFKQTNSWKPAKGDNWQNTARAKNVPFPYTMIGEGLRLAREHIYLNVVYYVNPAVFGFTDDHPTDWDNSPWHKDVAASDAKRSAVLDAMRTELDQYFQRVKSASYL